MKVIKMTSNTNKKILNLTQRGGFLIASFILPIFVMILVAAVNRMEPFGDRVLLTSDMNNQFTAFYSYFKNVILTNDDFFYTFSKCLGGDMVGMSAYYLNNPFLIFLFLFDNKDIVIGIFWIMVIQMGFMGLSFYTLLDYDSNQKEALKLTDNIKIMNLVFSTSYSLMGFALCYMVLPIYFNSMILLPLVFLGIRHFVDDEKHFLLYVITLAATIWCNYYLGYMTCLFSALYVLVLILTGKIPSLVKTVRFAMYSLLGVALSAVSLLPTVLSLSGTKDAPSGEIMTLDVLYNPVGLFRNLLPLTFTGDFSNDSAPYVFVGAITMFGLLLFLFSKEYSLKSKVLHVGLLLFLVISTEIKAMDVIWHGFNEPVGFAHRYAFIISFYSVYLGSKGFIAILYGQSFLTDKIKLKESIIKGCTVGLLVLQCMELFINARGTLNVHIAEAESKSDFDEYYDNTDKIINKIQEMDDSFYRIEKDFERNHNDAMEFSYAGLSHNSSCEKNFVKEFMGRMGFRNQGIWAIYNQGSTNFVDCLLGVKYFVSRFDTTDKLFTNFYDNGRTYVYENPLALDFAFVTGSDVQNVDMTIDNPFERQNQIARAFDFDEDIYSSLASDISVFNVDIEENVDIAPSNQSGTASIINGKATTYSCIDNNEKSCVTYTIIAQKDSNIYCYFSAPYKQKCQLYCNGIDQGDYFSDTRWGIVNLGRYKAGQEIKVTLELKEDEISLYDAYFYEEDLNALYAWSQNAKANEIQINKITSSHLLGEVNAVEDGILTFSIPYEKDWKIRVDGARVEGQMVLDCLIGVPVSKGDHVVELKYIPRGYYGGMICSLFSVVIICVIIIRQRQR